MLPLRCGTTGAESKFLAHGWVFVVNDRVRSQTAGIAQLYINHAAAYPLCDLAEASSTVQSFPVLFQKSLDKPHEEREGLSNAS